MNQYQYQGFVDKCAEYGIDPIMLIKCAQGKDLPWWTGIGAVQRLGTVLGDTYGNAEMSVNRARENTGNYLSSMYNEGIKPYTSKLFGDLGKSYNMMIGKPMQSVGNIAGNLSVPAQQWTEDKAVPWLKNTAMPAVQKGLQQLGSKLPNSYDPYNLPNINTLRSTPKTSTSTGSMFDMQNPSRGSYSNFAL